MEKIKNSEYTVKDDEGKKVEFESYIPSGIAVKTFVVGEKVKLKFYTSFLDGVITKKHNDNQYDLDADGKAFSVINVDQIIKK